MFIIDIKITYFLNKISHIFFMRYRNIYSPSRYEQPCSNESMGCWNRSVEYIIIS